MSVKKLSIFIAAAAVLLSCQSAPPPTFQLDYNDADYTVGLSLLETEESNFLVAGLNGAQGADINGFAGMVSIDGEVLWTGDYGAEGQERFYQVLPSNNGFYLLGFAEMGQIGTYDFYVVEIDPEGEVISENYYGSESPEMAYSGCSDGNGGFVIAGGRANELGMFSIIVQNISSDGESLWEQEVSIGDNDMAYGVVPTDDGGYAVTGYTFSNDLGHHNILIVKFSSDGEVQWENVYGSEIDEAGIDIIQTADGGFAVTGFNVAPATGSTDVFLMKTDSEGTQEWMRSYEGENEESAESIVQTEEGGYLVAGGQFQSDSGTARIWKLTPEGELEWVRDYESGDIAKIGDIVLSERGGYVAAGYSVDAESQSQSLVLLRTDVLGIIEVPEEAPAEEEESEE
ncbi:MAG: hypothetical protein ACLFR1_11230 [Spirochaetia bacterium]